MGVCGTERGYRSHLSLKQEICESCRSAHRDYSAAHRAANKDKYLEANRAYKSRNKEKIKEYSILYSSSENRQLALKRYRDSNLEKIRSRNRRNESRRRAVRFDVNHSPYTEEQILVEYGTNCHLCSGTIDLQAPRKIGVEGWHNGLHIDHVIPLAKGGDDSLSNVRPSHGICNLKKNAREAED